jgi:hypothetical protein
MIYRTKSRLRGSGEARRGGAPPGRCAGEVPEFSAGEVPEFSGEADAGEVPEFSGEAPPGRCQSFLGTQTQLPRLLADRDVCPDHCDSSLSAPSSKSRV